MPFLNSVVEVINNTLKEGKLNRHAFQDGKFHALAKQVIKRKDEVMIPVIFDIGGNEIDATIDDTYPIHLYHRITQPIVYSSVPKQESFGDGEDVKETATLSCVVFSDPKRISMTAEDLAFLIVAGMPSRFTYGQLGTSQSSSCLVTCLGAETSPMKILAQEYGNSFKEFDPEKILISINYKIDMTVDKSCVNCIGC